MPRRLPEKTKTVSRRPRRFKRSRYHSTIFQRIPVREGQEIEVVIDDIGSRGDGITRMHGYLIFVPKARIGERLKIKIVSVGRKFAIAEKITS
jgi:predicted RNA-binding protein with TRAM domain